MKKLLFCILFVCCGVMSAVADTELTLSSGQRIVGTIVAEDDDVVLIKDADGVRFQFQKEDIISRREAVEETITEEQPKKDKKVSLNIQLTGGAGGSFGYAYGTQWGGAVYIGTFNAFKKHIFIGGGLAYEAYILPQTYHFLPIEFRLELPIMQTKHAPMVAAAVGYNVSLQKNMQGGFCADLDFGWRCQISDKSASFIGLSLALRQAQAQTTETINNKEYTTTPKLPFSRIGLKMAIQF